MSRWYETTLSAADNLPDGSEYIINNPGKCRCERSVSGGIEQLFKGRDPLVLSLAANGLNFDQHAVIAGGSLPSRFAGVAKSRGFQLSERRRYQRRPVGNLFGEQGKYGSGGHPPCIIVGPTIQVCCKLEK